MICCYLHLEVGDKPLHGDFLFDLQEEAVAAQHHALQDVQGHLLYWCVGRLGVDKAGNLKGGKEGRQWREGSNQLQSLNKEICDTTKERQRQIWHLLDEDRWEVLPRNYPMIHQFHEASQCVSHDHITPEWHKHKERNIMLLCRFTHRLV